MGVAHPIYLIATCLFFLVFAGLVSTSKSTKPLVISSKSFLKHKATFYHPENPDRLSSCLKMLQDLDQQSLIRLSNPSGEHDENSYQNALSIISDVHDEVYIKKVKYLSRKGAPMIDPWDEDTYINRESFHQSVLAQSAWIDACNEVVKSKNSAFSIVRPPGHHASFNKSMGFCLFNFAVGAATHAIKNLGVKKVAIFDFDVHYGNGVADLVANNPNIRYSSIHQYGIFPYGRGSPAETGNFQNIRNIPLSGGEKWHQYEPLLVNNAIPFLKEFEPELLIVCSGYDALASEELASVALEPQDFGKISKHLKAAFGNAILFGLEGGYNIDDLPKALKESILPFTS